MDPQRTLIDNRIGSGARDQLILQNSLTGSLNKRDEDIQSPAAEAQRLSVLEQYALPGMRRNDPKAKVSSSIEESFSEAFRFLQAAANFRNPTALGLGVRPRSWCAQRSAKSALAQFHNH